MGGGQRSETRRRLAPLVTHRLKGQRNKNSSLTLSTGSFSVDSSSGAAVTTEAATFADISFPGRNSVADRMKVTESYRVVGLQECVFLTARNVSVHSLEEGDCANIHEASRIHGGPGVSVSRFSTPRFT